jgi:hypothetical protein
MPQQPTKKGRPTKARQFRFTDAEIDRIDAIARSLAPPGVRVTRIDVLRLALMEFQPRRGEKDQESNTDHTERKSHVRRK